MGALKLIVNVPTIPEAEEQLALAKDIHLEEPTKETYANVCRAVMVLHTKTIELSPEQLKELRKTKESA